MSLVRAAATVGSLTLASRVLGYVRDAMIAAVLGAGALADAFFVSFKLANMLRRLFAEGAFNAGFVPLFARTLEGEGQTAARRFAAEAFTVMCFILLSVVLLAEIAMPWLVRILATGFAPESERYALAVELSRITFPYLLFISLAALVSGVLNSIERFAAAAFAPILLNIVLIAALLLASLHPKTPAHALAWGVALAGIVQLAMLMTVAARAGYLIRPRWPVDHAKLNRLWRLVLPGAFGAGVYQINLVIDTWFASHLPAGAVAYLFYADRLNQLPLGMIGVALGTAVLPLLSRQLRAGNLLAAHATQNRALELALLLTLPATVGLIVMAQPIVELLFQRGAFDAAATRATAGALMAFSIGLPAYVLIKVLAPAFFARENTRTPVIVAACCLVANVAIVLVAIGPLAHVGIALATALANWLNAGLLGWLLWRKDALQPDQRLRHRLPRLVLAAAVMALALLTAEWLLAGLALLLRLPTVIGIGGAVYFATAQLVGGADLQDLRRMLTRSKAPAPVEPS